MRRKVSGPRLQAAWEAFVRAFECCPEYEWEIERIQKDARRRFKGPGGLREAKGRIMEDFIEAFDAPEEVKVSALFSSFWSCRSRIMGVHASERFNSLRGAFDPPSWLYQAEKDLAAVRGVVRDFRAHEVRS